MLFRTSLLFAGALVAVGIAPAEAKDHRRYDNRGYEYQNREMRGRGMDYHRDGVITQREWRGSDAAFRRQDRNRDGVLSGYELNSGRDGYYDRDNRYGRDDAYYGNGVTRGEWRGSRQDFERLDRNRNGVLTRDELRDWR